MRHMVTYPPDGLTIVGYGCSECFWRYGPTDHGEVLGQENSPTTYLAETAESWTGPKEGNWVYNPDRSKWKFRFTYTKNAQPGPATACGAAAKSTPWLE